MEKAQKKQRSKKKTREEDLQNQIQKNADEMQNLVIKAEAKAIKNKIGPKQALVVGDSFKTKRKGRRVKKYNIESRQYFLKGYLVGSPNLTFEQVEPVVAFYYDNQSDIAELFDVDASTISRWKNKDKEKEIDIYRSKTVAEMDELLALGIKIYGSEEAFKEWLETPNYALGSEKPIEIIREKGPFGVEMVEDALDSMMWGNVL